MPMHRPSFRVIYNQDATNLFGVTQEPITPAHVDRMVDEVAQGGADLMLINPQAQRTNYPSRVWQTMWDGYTPGRREFFGDIPDESVPARERLVGQMKLLADQGCDYLARALARCRQARITPGVSIRMNDMHDVPWPDSHLHSRFYKDHPQWRLENPAVSGWGRVGLDYRHAAVREHYLSLIRELVADYDFDVLDLDFLRFQCYFPRNNFADHCQVMTSFMADVRAILTRSGRPITLMARVAATPAAAYDLGFDVAAWARLGLVDAVAAGAFLNTACNIRVDQFKHLVGKNVAVYASTDHAAGHPTNLPMRQLSLDERRLRGFAASHREAGADGVYLFNFFCAREESPPHDPLFRELAGLAHPPDLRGKPKTYSLMSGGNLAETDGPCQLDRAAHTGRPQLFVMPLAHEPADVPVVVEVTVMAEPSDIADRYWLHVNETSAGVATHVRPAPDAPADKSMFVATFNLTGAAIHAGRNEIAFRNDGQSVTVVAVDVLVA